MNTSQPDRRRQARLPLLDGMRGIAAIAVMLFHAHGLYPGLEAFSRSYLFVDFFFLLSGFVLGLAAEPKLRSGLAWHAFMKARWVRLWPMIAIGSLIGAIGFVQLNSPVVTLFYLALGLLLIPAIHLPGMPNPLNAPQWSLEMEVLANFVHAVLLWRLPTRVLFGIAGIAGVMLAAQILAYGINNFENDSFSWPLALLRIAFAYTLGLAISRGHTARMEGRTPRSDWAGPFLLPIVVLVALPMIPLSQSVGDVIVTLLILPLGFLWATHTQLPQKLAPAFDWLGSLSYPLYTVHLPLILLISQWRRDALGLAVVIVATIGLAALLAHLFERRRAKRAPAEPKGAAPA